MDILTSLNLKRDMAGSGSNLDVFVSYDKKFVESWKKMVEIKASSIRKQMKWAMQEDCKVLQALFTRIAGLDSLWVTLQRECIEKYEQQRILFKDIIDGEKILESKRLEVKSIDNKVGKLIQKIDNKKSTEKRESDLLCLMNDQERVTDDYVIQRENHNIFKMHKFQKIISHRTDYLKNMHSKCLTICDSNRQVLDLFLSGNLSRMDPNEITQDMIQISASIVTAASQSIGIISNDDKLQNQQARQQWLDDIGNGDENDVYGTLVGDLDSVFANAIYNPIPTVNNSPPSQRSSVTRKHQQSPNTPRQHSFNNNNNSNPDNPDIQTENNPYDEDFYTPITDDYNELEEEIHETLPVFKKLELEKKKKNDDEDYANVNIIKEKSKSKSIHNPYETVWKKDDDNSDKNNFSIEDNKRSNTEENLTENVSQTSLRSKVEAIAKQFQENKNIKPIVPSRKRDKPLPKLPST